MHANCARTAKLTAEGNFQRKDEISIERIYMLYVNYLKHQNSKNIRHWRCYLLLPVTEPIFEMHPVCLRKSALARESELMCQNSSWFISSRCFCDYFICVNNKRLDMSLLIEVFSLHLNCNSSFLLPIFAALHKYMNEEYWVMFGKITMSLNAFQT